MTVEPSLLASVGFGLASAASWGTGDISGGPARRWAGAHGVVLAVQGVGVVRLSGSRASWPRRRRWPAWRGSGRPGLRS
jgi:hypothetical protein